MLSYERHVLGNISSERYWHLIKTSAASNVASVVGSSLGLGIGNFIGVGIGCFFGPIGAAVGGAIGSVLGSIIGGILGNLGMRKFMGGSQVEVTEQKKVTDKEKEVKYIEACKILNAKQDSTKREIRDKRNALV